MINPLLTQLRSDKKMGHMFKSSPSVITYSSGFPTLDYRNGSLVEVLNEQNEIEDKYPAFPLSSGSITTVLGESGTAKTSLVLQIASNIVRPFPAGFVQFFDVEKSMDLPRLFTLSAYDRNTFEDKFVFDQETVIISQIMDYVVYLADQKIQNAEAFKYDTGKKDVFGRPIIALQPTCLIIDSIPMLQVNEDSASEMEGQTAGGRKSLAITQLLEKITQFTRKANLLVFFINHIKDFVSMNGPAGFKKPSLIYMKSSKTMKGGKAAVYLAYNVWYLEAVEKYTYEDNGFKGFKTRLDTWKSRSSESGVSTYLVYDSNNGYDPILSLYEFAKDKDLIEGRNPKKYFVGRKEEATFDDRRIYEELKSNPALIDTLVKVTKPLLEGMLSHKTAEDILTGKGSEVIDFSLLESI